MFTDGLSEAVDGNGKEFGDEGLAEAARCNRQLSAEAMTFVCWTASPISAGAGLKTTPLSWSLLFRRQTVRRRLEAVNFGLS
jgi:hypothetical protein